MNTIPKLRKQTDDLIERLIKDHKLQQLLCLKNKSLIFCLFLITIFSCKEKITKVEINESYEDISNNITFELPGKRGTVVHHKSGPILPFENSYLPIPKGYKETTFSLNHDYPKMGAVKASTAPWKKITNNSLITQKNANEYVLALKKYVTPAMEKLLSPNDKWNWNDEPWYQSIWLGQVREPIHGMYIGSNFPAKTLGKTQDKNLTTYVLTMYDETAAQTLNNIWGTDSINAYNPNLRNENKTQYPEGSVIVKFAFINYDNATNSWPTLKGAPTWDVYTDVLAGDEVAKAGAKPELKTLTLMQFDIIVKDTLAAPSTGWVFSTLVFDKKASGTSWDKMIPLGATWGNNPEKVKNIKPAKALKDAIVPAPIDKLLTENWISEKAPSYAIKTLGWGGRLSGPNDGAVFSTGPVTTSTSGKHFTNGGVSTVGCLGCHSSAQYKFNSFLLPIVFPTPTGDGTPLVYDPGSTNWNRWFRNDNGKVPFDSGEGQIGLDYDMVTAFKAIPAWIEATNQ